MSASPERAGGADRPGGPKPKAIDIHAHFLVKAAQDYINRTVPADKRPKIRNASASSEKVNREQDERIEHQLSSPEQRLRDMDAAGIDIQLLSNAPRQFYYWTEPEVGARAAAIINDGLAETVAARPDRFLGIATLPMQAPDRAVAELRRAMKDLGLRGFQLGTHIGGVDLSDERFRPVFAAAEEMEAFILLHPAGNAGAGPRTASHHLDNIIGNPLEETIAVSHLIFGGVLDAFPKLRLCISHGGGFIAPYVGRWDHAYASRPDTRGVLSKQPSDYLRGLYLDSVVFSHPQLAYLAAEYGAGRILLGTDYPFDMGEEDPLGFIGRSPLQDADKTAILSGTAERLLKIA